MNFDVPVTSSAQPPAFSTRRTCEDWLAKRTLANPVSTQAELQQQLSLLSRYTLAEDERFAILEVLRGPLLDVQEDMAQKFTARALPLTPSEKAALDSTQALWQSLLTNYLHCLAASAKGPATAVTARIAQRTLAVLADWQCSLIHAEYLPPSAYWQKLNQIFASIEAARLSREVVKDPLRHGNLPTTPQAAFAECHLLHAASLFELPVRHIAWIARWARRWGSKIELLSAAPEGIRNRALPLWVDLAADRPAGYLPRPGARHGRWLETTALRTSLSARIDLLQKNRTPADLQLGDDVTQPAAGQLLARLLQRWCQGGIPRQHPRQAVGNPASAGCEFVVGINAVYFQLSDRRLFQPPAQDDAALRREREEMETFGGRRHSQASSGAESAIEQVELMDNGRLADESLGGLQLTRPLQANTRIGAGMLIAIRRLPATGFTVGAVRWVLCPDGLNMNLGVKLFHGSAEPAAARLLDPPISSWQPCLLLAGDAGATQEQSIILPAGSFRLGREIEIMRQDSERLRLTHLLDHGGAFERCSYEK
ncbi:MAG: hypothetical protein HZB64_07290 [Rhodocyclales bacterium]|nr:hypothetical protein [Rhodocyclales bacterium]